MKPSAMLIAFARQATKLKTVISLIYFFEIHMVVFGKQVTQKNIEGHWSDGKKTYRGSLTVTLASV